jgi:hypothetical protein
VLGGYVVRESLEMDAIFRAADNQQGVEYVSLKDALCNEQGCLTNIGSEFPNDLIVMDYGHLTKNGASYLSEQLLGEKILQSLQKVSTQSPR